MWKSAQLLKHLLLSGHEYPAIGIILTRVHDRVLIEDAGQNLGCFFELSFGNQVECMEYVRGTLCIQASASSLQTAQGISQLE